MLYGHSRCSSPVGLCVTRISFDMVSPIKSLGLFFSILYHKSWLSPISMDKESKRGQTTLSSIIDVLSSLLNSSNPGFPRRGKHVAFVFQHLVSQNGLIASSNLKGTQSEEVNKCNQVKASCSEESHMFGTSPSVWARRTPSVAFFVYKVNVFSLKVTKSIKSSSKLGIITFLRGLSTRTTVSNMIRVPSDKLTNECKSVESWLKLGKTFGLFLPIHQPIVSTLRSIEVMAS